MTASLQIKRPTLIWIAVVAGVGIGAYLLYSITTSFAGDVGPWYRPFLFASGVATLAGMVGLFNMKRWSLPLLVVYLTLSQLIALAFNVWNVSFLVPAIFIFIGYLYHDQME